MPEIKAQLHAGYLLSPVSQILSKYYDEKGGIPYTSLLEELSVFEIETNFTPQSNPDSIFSVYYNMISRGLPTIPSLYIEDKFSEVFSISKRNIHRGSVEYPYSEHLPNLSEKLYKALFLIDPRINSDTPCNPTLTSWEAHASEAEEMFFHIILPERIGEYAKQLIESQREITSMLSSMNDNSHAKFKRRLEGDRKSFYAQRVDFSFQFVKVREHPAGLVVEIDGPQHKEESQCRLDIKRDKALKEPEWQRTIRIPVEELMGLDENHPYIKSICEFLKHPYAEQCKKNYDEPLTSSEEGLSALEIALSPIAIARIQKALAYLVLNGSLNVNNEQWNIAIIERDMPCACLAIEDFKQSLENLFALENRGRKLPEITLKVFSSEEFRNRGLNSTYSVEPLAGPIAPFNADVVIDISVLQRPGFSKLSDEFIEAVSYHSSVIIRSCHSTKEKRKFISARPIAYQNSNKNQIKSLQYFLQNLFRKEDFREGQVKILQKALGLKDVIGLLPTGAGKSLTYQLAGLLQPGIVMVVDPLISLMRDQKENLNIIGIDATAFINSAIKNPKERLMRTQALISGEYLFTFVSPERFQILEFRNRLGKMVKKGVYFTYCVVDEAHCVSEWGHDFRTAYLMLGKNVRKYCKPLSNSLPIFGLTGTASYNVLSDVRKDLIIKDDTAIIAPSKYQRDELKFEIIDTTNEEIAGADEKEIKKKVAAIKTTSLINFLDHIHEKKWVGDAVYTNIEDFFSKNNVKQINSGIVFCPHVEGVFGVEDVCANVTQEIPALQDITGMYAAKLAAGNGVDLEVVQNNFKNNKLQLLFATKAFGMGIDKPNIRCSVHFNMPPSIEAFYQEAGRAGRDRKRAYCALLYNKALLPQNISVDKSLMMNFFHNSFPGVEKEKAALTELLTEITYPDLRMVRELQEAIPERIEESVFLRVWTGTRYTDANGNWPKRLYIKEPENFGEFGYINLYTWEIGQDGINLPDGMDIDEAHQKMIALKECLSDIKDIKNANQSYVEWILTRNQKTPKPGIERVLSEVQNNSKSSVIIEFTNQYFDRIVDLLDDMAWDDDLISKAYPFSNSPETFIENLKSQYYKKTNQNINIPQAEVEAIRLNYKKIRDETDTFKAIYRLTLIGVISDYVVDYNSRTITATVQRENDKFHRDALEEYFIEHLSVTETNKLLETLDTIQGSSVIQRCCNLLINFVYDKIAKKRMEAINVMEGAILAGLKNHANFEDYVNYYFDSKFLPDLRPYLTEYSIQIVWEFLEKIKGEPDSVFHLLGACNRLLVENTGNPVFLMLRAGARLLAASENSEIALEDLDKGCGIFKELEAWSHSEFLNQYSKFYRVITTYNSTLKAVLDNHIFNFHLTWLTDFNSNFLKGIENARNS